tara:strand:- start:4 stop:1353 length:1350 start_codon:yes stop_codon:yes gene_type:complete
MAIELNQREIIEALGNLDFSTMGARGLSGLGSIQNIGTNLAGGLGNFLQNIPNIPQQQGPVLGPDDFGSYTIPFSDPTYRTGFDYARSIAGGMPMEQVIAPGVSYSPEQPGGYTQAQLNIPKDVVTPPPEPPKPDDPSFLGTGIGGVNIPVDRKQIPPRNIFGGLTDTRGQRERGEPLQGNVPGGGGIDYGPGIGGGLLLPIPPQDFGFGPGIRPTEIIRPDGPMIGSAGVTPPQDNLGFDREQLMKDIRESIDIPKPPSIDREALIEDITSRINIPQAPRIDREDLIKDITQSINIPSYEVPDLSGFARLEDIPTFDPSGLQEQIQANKQLLSNIPQFNDRALKDRLDMLENQYTTGFDELNNRFAPPTAFDDTSIQERLAMLESREIPTFDPDVLKQDILMSIPQQAAPDLSGYNTRIAELEQQLASLNQPNGGSFSISQPMSMGLF